MSKIPEKVNNYDYNTNVFGSYRSHHSTHENNNSEESLQCSGIEDDEIHSDNVGSVDVDSDH